MSFESLLNIALWLAGVGHFTTLIAGSQVPYRLEWKTDLQSLKPFNRKLLWTYLGFIGFVIISLGTLTLLLHDEMIRGDRSALALATFIALFWTLRIVVDALVFDHRDWPKGKLFLIGHILLTTLFIFLVGTYTSLILWHMGVL